jgi:hypothetical protein
MKARNESAPKRRKSDPITATALAHTSETIPNIFAAIPTARKNLTMRNTPKAGPITVATPTISKIAEHCSVAWSGTAETRFAKAHPDCGYTCMLSQLPRSAEITRLLGQNRVDNGYAFEIIGCQAAVPEKPNTTYYVTAPPLQAGQPAFCSDQSGVLMSDDWRLDGEARGRRLAVTCPNENPRDCSLGVFPS